MMFIKKPNKKNTGNLNFSIQLFSFVFFLLLSSSLFSAPVFTSNSSKIDLSQAGLNDIADADLNQDGNTDVVITEYNGIDGTATVEILFGDGTGGYGNTFTLKSNPGGGDGLFFNPEGLGIGDVNGDGVLDIAVTAGLTSDTGTNDTHLSTYIFTGILTGTGNNKTYEILATNFIKLVTATPAHDVVIADFNQDSIADVVIAHRLGLDLFLGTSAGVFGSVQKRISSVSGVYDIQTSKRPDGYSDIITDHEILFNNTPADKTLITFDQKVSYPETTFPIISTLVAVTAGDFNGDSIVDVAYALNFPGTVSTPVSSQMVVMLSSGSGTNVIYTKKETAVITDSVFVDIATADIDLDGIADIVTLDNKKDTISIYAGFGDGTFSVPDVSAIIPATNAATRIQPQLLLIADIDKNREIDILTANDTNSSTPSLSVLLQQPATDSFIFGPGEYFVPLPTQTSTFLPVNVVRKYISEPATAVTLKYEVVGVSAVNGIDFNALPGQIDLLFSATDLSQTIMVEILPDTGNPDSSFSINLTDSSTTVLDTATVVIQSNTPLPTLNFTASNFDLYEDQSNVTLITVVRTPSNTLSVSTVEVSSEDIVTADPAIVPATEVVDYEKLLATTLTFASGVDSQSFTIPIVDDALDEGNEKFRITLSNATNAVITNPVSDVTIIDNDIAVVVLPTALADTETIVNNTLSKTFSVIANDKTTPATILINPTSVNITTDPIKGSIAINKQTGDVTYTLKSKTESGTDGFTYTVDDNNGSTSLPATVTMTIIEAPIANDDSFFIITNEISKTFVILDNDSVIAPNQFDPATINIINQPNQGTLSIDAAGIITYTLTAITPGTDSFTYTIDDNDSISSPSEIATVVISILEPAQVLPGIFSFDSNNNYTVSEETGVLTLNVVRGSGSTGEVTLTYLVTDQLAIAGTDFKDTTTTPGSLLFAEGVTSMPITFEIVKDNDVEANQDFTIELSTVTAGVIVGSAPVTVTITDSTIVNPTQPAAGGGSSGGCTLQVESRFDPVLPLLMMFVLFYFGRRVRFNV